MKIIAIVLFLMPSLVLAGSVETKYFKLNLPDNYQAETNKRSKLIAFGGKSPRDLPFLDIEFGPRLTEQFPQVISRLNKSIISEGKSLEKIDCAADNCEAYYVEFSQNLNGRPVTRIHYAVKSEQLSFIISLGTTQENGKEFVLDLGTQVMNGIE